MDRKRIRRLMTILAFTAVIVTAVGARNSDGKYSVRQTKSPAMPAWVSRGLPGQGHLFRRPIDDQHGSGTLDRSHRTTSYF